MTSKIETQINKLRREVASDEAKLEAKRSKLAKLEARRKGEKPPETGLDILWKTALPKSRERSSKYRCRTAWNRIPASQRPPVKEAISALKAWNKCEEWTKEHSQFAPGLHRFITERMWEDIPEVRDPFAKWKSTKPKPQPTGEEMELDDAVDFLNSKDDEES